MRRLHTRLTIRSLMFVVMIVALGIVFLQQLALSARYRSLARIHASLERDCIQQAKQFDIMYMRTDSGLVLRDAPSILVPVATDGSGNRIEPLDWRTEAARHSRLKERYERASRYPWLGVRPEPPETE
jgi:hypothetical protein